MRKEIRRNVQQVVNVVSIRLPFQLRVNALESLDRCEWVDVVEGAGGTT